MNDPQNNNSSFSEKIKQGFTIVKRVVKEKWISFKEKKINSNEEQQSDISSASFHEPGYVEPTNNFTTDSSKTSHSDATIDAQQETDTADNQVTDPIITNDQSVQDEAHSNSADSKDLPAVPNSENVDIENKSIEEPLEGISIEESNKPEEIQSDTLSLENNDLPSEKEPSDQPVENKIVAFLLAAQVILLAEWNKLKRKLNKADTEQLSGSVEPPLESNLESDLIAPGSLTENPEVDALDSSSEENPANLLDTKEETYELAIIPALQEEVPTPPTDSKKKLIFSFNVTYGVIKSLILSLIIAILVGGALASGIGLGYFAYLVSTEKPPTYEEMKADITNLEQSSTMYFADNQPIGAVKSDLVRKVVPLSDMSKNLQHAIIATEDEYFYKHNGIVPKAVARALTQEFTGAKVQTGGSTLTQQLVKQQILTSEVSFKRKANEILLAIRLENYFSKDEILEAYLNTSTFGRNSSGQNIAGVEEAALGIFGVRASELNLAQSAFIAGLPQSPSLYTPYNQLGELRSNLEPGLERKNTVLFRMYREKFISKKDYEEALNYDLVKDFVQPTQTVDNHDYSFLYNRVLKEATLIVMKKNYTADKLTEKDITENDTLYNKYYFEAESQIQNNGYEIRSTIDKGVYDAMQNVVANYGDQFGQTYYRNKVDQYTGALILDKTTGEPVMEPEPVQNGSVLMDNATGRVIGFVGGRDFSISEVDHAFSTHRQPGSTIKPLLVYAPAIEQGLIQPATMIPDTAINFTQSDGSSWNPSNYGGSITGKFISARDALKRSYNNPTAKIYLEMLKSSPEGMKPEDYMKKMGFTSISDAEYESGQPALSLGGTETGPTVMEQTNAFAAVANNGTYVEGYMIENITDKKGNVIYQHEAKSETVFTPQTAYLTIDMMRSVVESGTAAGILGELNFSPDLAGKTGTTNDFIDVWFVASTPQVTLSSWIGYDNDGESRHQLQYYDNGADFDASGANESYWAQLANAIYSVNPTIMGADKSFTRPPGISSSTVLEQTGMKPGKMTLPDGKTIDVTGPTRSDLFNTNFIPGVTTYDFAVGANSYELNNFWYETYLKARETEEKKKKEEEDRKKKEQEDKKKEEEDKKKTEEEKKKNEDEAAAKKKKEEEDKKKAEEEANKPTPPATPPPTAGGTTDRKSVV